MRESGTRADGTTWYGTPLANLTGYLGVIERDAGQLTTAGGTVNINAGSSVVLQNGSIIRAAGGYQDFAGGAVTTTRLIDDGNLVDIADADPSVVYDGIYDPSSTTIDPRWGVTTTTDGIFAANTRLESAHVFGGAGGSVSISAPAMALDGTLAGGTVTGPQQLSAAPAYSSLTLKWQSQLISRTNPQFPLISPTPPAITFRDTASTLPAAAAFALDGSGAPLALRSERLAAVDLSPTLLTTQGFGSLAVHNGDGNISIPAGVTLNVRAAGSITLRGANVDVQGGIIAPSGRIDLTAYNISPFTSAILLENGSTVMPAPNAGRGIISVGTAARLSTAGLIINDRADAPAPLTVPHSVTGAGSTLDGGTISLDGYSIDLLTASMLDVTGGLVAGKGITYGDAGTISLHAGRDPILKSLLGGHLDLGSTLRGLSGAEGGSLDLLAPVIQIGGTTTNPNALLLEPEFFSQGGFSHFKMTGLGSDTVQPAVIITPGVQIMPQVRSLLADVSLNNGMSSLLLSELLQPEGYRNTAHLDFEAPGVKDSLTQLIRTIGRIQMGAGSSILTDALGSVTMHGQVIDLLGEITTPGGSVDIQGADHYPEDSPSAFAITTVHVGSTARVSTAGKTVYLNDIYNNRRGHVYAGGSITVSGNIVADAGSLFDVSGTSAIIDLLPQEAGLTLDSLNAVSLLILPANTIPTLVTSNGGSLTWKGAEFLIPRSTMVGLAGGAGAQGGVLSVSSGRFVPVGNARDDKETSLTVAQSLAGLSAATLDRGWFAADSFLSGGFDSLRLAGNVDFRNAVDITARGYLSIADGGVIRADALTRLTAAYVTLGRPLARPTRDEELVNPFQVNDSAGSRPSYFSPTGGAGRLEVIADQIDAGTLSLQNISSAALTARQELRGSGFLDIAGSWPSPQVRSFHSPHRTSPSQPPVRVAASASTPVAQIQPSPLQCRREAEHLCADHFTTRGSASTVWQHPARLGMAPEPPPRGLITNTSVPIAQQITLGAGSTTSVSAIDPRTGTGVTIPYGIVKDGTNWIDPTGLDITATGVPEKTLRVSAQNITTEAGSTLDLRGGGTFTATAGFRAMVVAQTYSTRRPPLPYCPVMSPSSLPTLPLPPPASTPAISAGT
ncbi:MAG: hypothetical protein IPK32_08950 [Verrucomicrobiaceae bacterium]|nr:hypothetical protein [Verrucomicrobiaceae bacterium]